RRAPEPGVCSPPTRRGTSRSAKSRRPLPSPLSLLLSPYPTTVSSKKLGSAGKLRIITRLTPISKPGGATSNVRAGHAFGQKRQHLRPLLRDGDGVLDVRRGPAVEGDDRPAVREGLRPVRAHVDHRLDGEDVARTDFDAGARLSVVRDL